MVINESDNNTLEGNIGMINGGGNPYFNVKSGLLTLAGAISTVTGNNARTLTLGGAGNGLISGLIGEASGVTLLSHKTRCRDLDPDRVGNAYNGATTVNGGTLIINAAGYNQGNGAIQVNSGGTLIVNGANYGTGTVTVGANGVLSGIGQIYSAVTFQAGGIGLFNSSSAMTIYGNVTMNTNSITVFVPGGTPLSSGTYPLLVEGNTALYGISGSVLSTPTITGAGIAANMIYYLTTSSSQISLVVAQNSTWVNNGNGNWTTGVNWSSSPSYPNGAGQGATLGIGSSLTTINLDNSATVGVVNFTNGNSFVITNAANTLSLNNNGNGANFNVTAGTANSIGAGVSLNDATTVNASAGAALSIPGSVNGGGSFTKTGNGALTLSGSNTCSGLTALSGGTLILGSTNAIGSGTFTISGGSLDSSVPNLVNDNNNAQNWNGSFGFVGSQNLNLGTGNVNMSGNIALTVSSNQLTAGGVIGGSGVLTFTNGGVATLELDGANTFSGGFTVVGGATGSPTVIAGNNAAFGTGTLNLTPANGPGVTLLTSATRTITNNVSVNTFDGPFVFAGPGSWTFSGTMLNGNGQKRFYVTNTIVTWSGPFTDNGAPSGPFIKDGSGTLVLSGSNSVLLKPITVNAGILALGSTNAIGTGALTMGGGVLDSTVPNLINAGNNPQSWTASFGFAGSQNLNLGTGSVTISASTTITVSNNTLTVGGAVSGSGALAKAGSGTLILAGANTYTNNTTVSAGTLELVQATLATNSAVSISNSAALQLDFSATNQVAALILNGVSQSAGVYKSANSGGLITGAGALAVVPLTPPINTNAPIVQVVSTSPTSFSLAWPTNLGWILQTNSVALDAASQWHDYPGSAALTNVNITINPAQTNVFFRMVHTNTP